MIPRRTVVTVPPQAKAGEIITLRVLAQHPMENGFRHDENGQRIARDMINRFRCDFNGVTVFRTELIGGIAANPLIQFTLRATQSGRVDFFWEGDHGYATTASAQIEVT